MLTSFLAAPTFASDAAKIAITSNQRLPQLFKNAATAKKHVFVSLKNGKEYSATQYEASSSALVLKGPKEKEFYDVYIPLSEIASVEFRVRDN